MLAGTRSLAAASLAALLMPLAAAIPCVSFDASWNLYAFGGSSDVALGASSSWGSPNPQTLTTSGRPPWTGKNSQCFLSQYNNALYVLNADASDASKVYIYSFGSSSWSTQSTTSVPSGLGSIARSATVLDHDTNVFFSLVGNTMYQLDFSSITSSAGSSAPAWSAVENPSFSTSGYNQVTSAQASNHIAFFGVPGTAAGSANMFVIHYAYFQPTAQSFPTQNGGAAFPDTPGQAVSVPDAQNNAGNQMIFVPNDFSNTYVVSHWTNPSNYADTSGAPFATSQINTTQTLPAPSSQDINAAYAASPSSIVQIDSSGNIYYIANAISNYQVASGASWTKMSYTLSGTGTSNTNSTSVASGSSGASSTAASGSASASATGSSSSSASGSSGASGASSAGAAATSKSAAGAAISRGDALGLAGGIAAVLGALLL